MSFGISCIKNYMINFHFKFLLKKVLILLQNCYDSLYMLKLWNLSLVPLYMTRSLKANYTTH